MHKCIIMFKTCYVILCFMPMGIYAVMYLSADDPENITGYTFDYQVGSTCSFYLKGAYESEKKRFKGVNTTKIQKAFFHGRGKYTLFYEEKDGEEYLIGRARQKGVHGFVLSFGGAFKNRLVYKKIKPKEQQANLSKVD